METKTKEDAGRLLVSVLTIVTTVIAGNFGVDYRQAERTAIVHEEVAGVASQNQEILDGIALILDQNLQYTQQVGEKNAALNRAILEKAEKNRSLNTEILDRLDILEQQLGKTK